jgi:ribosomal protein L19
LLDEYKIRRSKLYYIREKIGKSARMKSKITADKRDTDLLK